MSASNYFKKREEAFELRTKDVTDKSCLFLYFQTIRQLLWGL